jgi:hypothetical protein
MTKVPPVDLAIDVQHLLRIYRAIRARGYLQGIAWAFTSQRNPTLACAATILGTILGKRFRMLRSPTACVLPVLRSLCPDLVVRIQVQQASDSSQYLYGPESIATFGAVNSPC